MLGKKMSNNTATKGRNSNQGAASVEPSTSSLKNIAKGVTTSASAVYPTANVIGAGPSAIREPKANFSTHIKTSENFKILPRYSVALSLPHDESLPAEELDAVQLELETLLSTVALRYRSLKTEYESLDREDKKHKKGIYGSDKQPNTPNNGSGKRKRYDGNNKKSSKEANRYFGQQVKLSKLKNNSSNSPAHSQHTDDSMDAAPYYQSAHTSTARVGGDQPNQKQIVPKNDIPNKFWLSVEPYCMPITHEDIKLLDDLIEEYSGPLVPPIPELGPHYATQWAADDLRDEQDNSNQNAKANKRYTNASNADVINMIKKGDKLIGEGITGPLTQRLVSALLEENLMQSDITGSTDGTNKITNENNDCSGENNSSSANRSNTSPITSLLKSGVDVEKRLKKELIELGILDMSDFPKEKDDEVLNEIKRVRTELYAIAEYNHNELKLLYAAAKEEMKRLEIKRKLDMVDQELIEQYKKVWSAKQKRRPLTKQERSEIFRLSDEQKRLSAQLEMMPIPGFNNTKNTVSSSHNFEKKNH